MATEAIRISLSYNGQNKYEADPSNSHGKYGDYSILNTEIAYRFNTNWEISGEVRNLTDNKSQYVYYDPPSNQVLFSPHDGRAFYVNLRMTY